MIKYLKGDAMAIAIRYIKGDATCPQGGGTKIVVQICNNLGRWGRGFVMAVSSRWPQCRAEYLKWYNDRKNNDFALGNVQFVQVEKYICVANMIGQQGIRGGSKGPPIRYEAVKQCLVAVAEQALSLSSSVHMPRIGCGIGDGKWNKVEPIIAETLCQKDIKVTVYDY